MSKGPLERGGLLTQLLILWPALGVPGFRLVQPGLEAVEPLQNKNAETVGRATKRAARELTGDDGNFVVTTDLGNEFATLDRELPEAVHRTRGPPWWTGASRR